MGTAGVSWIPPRIDLASFPQPDVSSCRSAEQQGRLGLCLGGVSWTRCPGQAHFPGSSSWDMSCRLRDRPPPPSQLQAALQPRLQLPVALSGSILLSRSKGAVAPALCLPSLPTQHRDTATVPKPWAARSPGSHLCQAGSKPPSPALSCSPTWAALPAPTVAPFLTECSALSPTSANTIRLCFAHGETEAESPSPRQCLPALSCTAPLPASLLNTGSTTHDTTAGAGTATWHRGCPVPTRALPTAPSPALHSGEAAGTIVKRRSIGEARCRAGGSQGVGRGGGGRRELHHERLAQGKALQV